MSVVGESVEKGTDERLEEAETLHFIKVSQFKTMSIKLFFDIRKKKMFEKRR